MVDLGGWASEQYRVEGGKTADNEHPDDFTADIKRKRGPLN